MTSGGSSGLLGVGGLRVVSFGVGACWAMAVDPPTPTQTLTTRATKAKLTRLPIVFFIAPDAITSVSRLKSGGCGSVGGRRRPPASTGSRVAGLAPGREGLEGRQLHPAPIGPVRSEGRTDPLEQPGRDVHRPPLGRADLHVA